MPKIETKSTIIILATFILGFLLGLMSSQYLIRNRLKPLRHGGEGPKIGLWLDRAVHPDDAQRKKLEEITADFHKRMRLLRKEHMEENKMLLDSLMISVRPHLSKEQMKAFEQFQMRNRGPESRDLNRPKNGEGRSKRLNRKSKGNY